MNIRIISAALFLYGTAGILTAANDCKIITTDGREIKTARIEARENGDLEYLSPDGKLKNRIARGRYRYAQIPKPALVTAADQKFRDQQWKSAAALYQKAGTEYKLLGWDVYCIRMEAESRVRSGEKKQAEEMLAALHEKRNSNPDQAHDLALADNLLADLLIDRKQFDAAEKILNRQILLDDSTLVFSAYLKKAVILQGRGKKREAAMQFYRTALLFPQNPRRAEALYGAWNLLSELKSPEAGKVAKLLKREYPDSSYAKQAAF